MIELKSISKKYSIEIFKDFSFKFDKNNIYFLSGKNGSGKSTLLKLIKGIYICDEGEIAFNYSLKQNNDIAYIDGNYRTFFHRLTVRQNIDYFYSLQNRKNDRTCIDEFQEFFNISNLQNKKFSSLSQGQMQIISIFRGIASNPKVILLDEVFSSLDNNHKNNLFSYLSKFILKDDTLVIFTSHDKNFQNLVFNELCLN
tara:strand:+ start:461 stop:1057 length:597 start_codon:yes stop_codon:yes gene_type:complete